jgi:MYXO-CTERM domain-containing protein
MIVRGDVVPGLVGGALAAVLCVLVLRRVEERRRRDRR